MPTRLTHGQLAELRERAGDVKASFVDPAQLTRVTRFVAGRHDWASVVVGHPFNLLAMTNRELVLLDLAAKAEPEPPAAPRPPASWEPGYQPSERERADAARRDAQDREWRRLADALPVPVTVAYNYSGPRHLESYLSGADHIIVRERLHVARLDRAADRSLCWTPSRARSLDFALLDDHTARIPTCKACLRIAYRVADLAPADELLLPRSRTRKVAPS